MAFTALRDFVNRRFLPQNIFACCAILFGMLFIFITPPFQVPDEYVHYFRAYSIATGSPIEERRGELIGNWLPVSMAIMTDEVRSGIQFHFERKFDRSLIKKYISQPLEPGNKTFIDYPSTAVYSPVPYAPQVLGIAAGRIFSLSPLALLYLGRIANLAFWIALVYLAIAVIPLGRWLIFLLALSPMSLFQAASVSPDGLTNALAFLLIALFLRALSRPGPRFTTFKSAWPIIALAAAFSLTKQSYFFVPLIFISVAPFCSANKKTIFIFSGALLAAVALPNLLWWCLAKNLVVPLQEGLNPSAQVASILSSPIAYLSILVKSVITNADIYARTFIGRLGWLDTPLPAWIYISYCALLVFFTISREKIQQQFRIRLWPRLLMLGVFVGGTVLILTSLFISWTPVGEKIINGVQGRYFIPLAPWLFFAFYGCLRAQVANFYFGLIAGASSIIILSVTALTLLARYYT